MAERRMFAKSIIDSDAFLEMPMSTQCLYFHLAMRADDEGFVGNPKSIQRTIGASNDDMRVLIAKRFLLAFDSGVVVIKHWKIHNYLQNDRVKPTTYLEEKSTLTLDGKKAYTEKGKTECIQNVYIGENRLDKNSIDYIKESTKEKTDSLTALRTVKHKHGEYKNVLLTDAEKQKLETEYGVETTAKAITYLDEYIEMKGYKAKSHYLCLRKWVFEALKEHEQQGGKVKKACIGGIDIQRREYTVEQLNGLFTELDEEDEG